MIEDIKCFKMTPFNYVKISHRVYLMIEIKPSLNNKVFYQQSILVFGDAFCVQLKTLSSHFSSNFLSETLSKFAGVFKLELLH